MQDGQFIALMFVLKTVALKDRLSNKTGEGMVRILSTKKAAGFELTN